VRAVLNMIRPEPERALSEGADTLPLDDVEPLVAAFLAISVYV
jgi:3-deoxy-D-manno-octulosonic acid (KDO) 8-phosphate synthase